MEKIVLLARAKLNLTLDILGRRADGYHEIETVMQSVTLADTVRLRRREQPGVALRCSDPSLPAGPENLAFRAAQAFFRASGREDAGVAVELIKRIPSGAGLAGGSADAAAVLAGLNRMLDAAFSPARLCGLGASLGADIPFCLTGGTQIARGIGERLFPAPTLPECAIVVAKPAESVSTAAAYAAFDRLTAPVRPDLAGLTAGLAAGDLRAVGRCLGNVFEQAGVPAAVPAIRSVMKQAGALGSCMTGSGSAVCGLFEGKAQARLCAGRLERMASVWLCGPAREGWTEESVR